MTAAGSYSSRGSVEQIGRVGICLLIILAETLTLFQLSKDTFYHRASISRDKAY